MKKISGIVAGVCIFLVFILKAVPVCSDTPGKPDGKWVIEQMQKQSSAIRDFTVNLNITCYACLMCLPVKAKLYFKRPDKVKMDFYDIPDFLRGYEKEFKAVVPAETFRKKYTSRLMGKESDGETTLYVLALSPVKESNLKRAYLWVNTGNFTCEKMFLAYRDGSTIEVENEFMHSGEHQVIKRQKISFRLSTLNAKAIIAYSNYLINRGIPDSVFEEKDATEKNSKIQEPNHK